MARIRRINKDQDQDLIGGNFTNDASKTVFSLGNFAVESNFTGRRTKDFSSELSSFVTPITLETLNISEIESEKVFEFTNNITLNFDKSDLKSYVRFGSCEELFRVSVENIIIKYPASLFVSSQIDIGGNITINNFSYDSTTNTSTFRIPSYSIVNPFALIIDEGNTAKPNENELKNLNLSYNKFVIWRKNNPNDNTHSILEFTGDTPNRAYIILKVNGNPFEDVTGTTGSINFHIKPQPFEYNKFYSSLNQLEQYFLSDRLSGHTGFSIKLKEPINLENGGVLYSDIRLTWPTTDGYNIDFSERSTLFQSFYNSLISIGRNYDIAKTDLIARMLTPTSLKVYDLTEDGKMTKLLRIYGREFDELKTFIDSLVYINKVSYDKNKNIPDILVKNLAKTLGWDVFSLVKESDIVESFFSMENEKSSSDSMLPAEIDIELWRRILINTNYFWKSKGTRHAIKSMFLLIGIPEPFINITEYVYTVDGKINPDEVELSLEDLPSASFPFNSEGYPQAPVETKDFYFQISGNSDNGQAYMNVFRQVGFNLNRTVDNKKSWVYSGFTERVHYTTPNYYQEDSKLVLNTKEVDVNLDIARGIEYDVYSYNKYVDGPITSTGVTKPYVYINIDLQYTGNTMTFKLPEQPLSGSNVQMNFNGITLTPTTGITGGDYVYDSLNNEINLISESAITHSNGIQDIITITYLYNRLGTTGYTSIQYLVQAPTVLSAGAILQLPQEPKGDIQLVVNGVTMTKGTSLFTGDFIIDPNDRTKIIIQNNTLKNYLLTNPVVRVWYIVDGNKPSNARKRSEAHRVDSFNSTKFFYNSGVNRYVYVMDYAAFDIDSIKITINGITLQNGTDFTLNPTNKKQIYLPANSVQLGYIIGAYYIIDDGTMTPPLLPADPTFPDIGEMSFLEYLELITRRLINVRTRKTITDNVSGYYPTVQNIYEEYLKRGFLPTSDPLHSNGYTFKNLYPFISQYNAFFSRFVNQLLPSTIILRKGGIMIRNTVFTRQKFKYRRGVNFDPNLMWLGDDGSEFVKVIPTYQYSWTNDYVCTFIPVTTTLPPTTTTTLAPTTTTLPPTTTTLPVPVYYWLGYGTSEGKMLKTSDAGVTWSEITIPEMTSTAYKSSFRNLTGYVIGTSNNNFLKTTNGGSTWTNIPAGVNNIISVYAVTENLILAGSTLGNKLYRSTNGGLSWSTINFTGNPMAIQKFYFANASIGYALYSTPSSSIYSCLLKTTNGGVSWTNITGSLTSDLGSPSSTYPDLAINASGLGYLIKTVGGSLVSDKLLKTTNGGTSWTELTTTPTGYSLQNVLLLSDNTIILHAKPAGVTTELAILKSTDGGLTWDIKNPIEEVLGPGTLGSSLGNTFVHVDDNNFGTLVFLGTTVTNKAFVYTKDKGVTWNMSDHVLLDTITGTVGGSASQAPL